MEPVSENQNRRERGRPAQMSPEQISNYQSLFPDVQTRRGQQNLMFRFRAMGVLKDDARFRWLVDQEKALRGAPNALRPSILTELGRFDDENVMRTAALRICELKPSARQAVNMIRRVRTGARGDGNAVGLSQAIIRAINDYLITHPATAWHMVHAALEKASDAVAASSSPGESDGQDPEMETAHA